MSIVGGKEFEEHDQSACFSLAVVALAEHLLGRADEGLWRRLQGQAANCMAQFRAMVSAPQNDKTSSEVLRPRIIESLFVLWHLTRDPIYRLWGLEFAQLLEQHWWVDAHGYQVPPGRHQPSYLLSDTFKFLYLLFSPEELVSPKLWVFNHYGHAYPVNFIDPAPVRVHDPPVDPGIAIPNPSGKRHVRIVRIRITRKKKPS